MDSPFDAIVKEKEENGAKEKKESPEQKIRAPASSVDSKPKMLERFVYYVIIIALITVIFVNPLCDSACKTSTKSGNGSTLITGKAILNTTKDTKNQSAEITITSNTQKVKNLSSTVNESAPNATNAGIKATAASQEEDNTEKPFLGNLDFKIEDVQYTKDEETNNPKKIKSITFSIWNRWKDFRPRIEVYWYDSSADNILKETKNAEAIIISKRGAFEKSVIESFRSTYFYPGLPEETIELRLYDSDTGILLTTKTTQIP